MIGDEGAEALASIVAEPACSLLLLALRYNDITDRGCKALSQSLEVVLLVVLVVLVLLSYTTSMHAGTDYMEDTGAGTDTGTDTGTGAGTGAGTGTSACTGCE